MRGKAFRKRKHLCGRERFKKNTAVGGRVQFFVRQFLSFFYLIWRHNYFAIASMALLGFASTFFRISAVFASGNQLILPFDTS